MSCSIFFIDNSELEWYQTDGVYHVLKSTHKDTQSLKILLCLARRFILAEMVVETNKHKNNEAEF